jgi:hypothetical protein
MMATVEVFTSERVYGFYLKTLHFRAGTHRESKPIYVQWNDAGFWMLDTGWEKETFPHLSGIQRPVSGICPFLSR